MCISKTFFGGRQSLHEINKFVMTIHSKTPPRKFNGRLFRMTISFYFKLEGKYKKRRCGMIAYETILHKYKLKTMFFLFRGEGVVSILLGHYLKGYSKTFTIDFKQC